MVRLQSLDMSMSLHCRFSRLCQPVLPAVVLSDQTNHFLTFVPVTNIPSQRGGGGELLVVVSGFGSMIVFPGGTYKI
jgi:hypothetical protein